MRKVTLGLCSILLLFSITAAQPGSSTLPTADVVMEIQVSPSTILLDWKAQGNVKVTVHTDVSYYLFTSTSVFLGGVEASYIKSDARGNLVAKFDFWDIVGLVEEGTAILTLEATDKYGTIYVGSDEVRVVAG